jgi:hypothetical protein
MQPLLEEDLRCMQCDREAEAVIIVTNFVPTTSRSTDIVRDTPQRRTQSTVH